MGRLAGAVVRAFCRPDLPRAAWAEDLGRLLTLSAASVYSTVDPARVSCTRTTGRAHLAAGDAFTQPVLVPTDAGTYRVTLSRPSPSAPWRASLIVPVEAGR